MSDRDRRWRRPAGASVAVLPDARGAGRGRRRRRRSTRPAGRSSERGRFTIALAGGSTPKPVYRLLAAPPFAGVDALGADRRLLGRRALRGRRRSAQQRAHGPGGAARPRARAGRAGAPDAVRRWAGGGRGRCGPAAPTRPAAGAYERLLRSARPGTTQPCCAPLLGEGGGLDLVLLGLGDDGHTASLFPGSEALDERERWVVAARRTPATAPSRAERHRRAALAGDAHRTVHQPGGLVLFVVSGAPKAPAVQARAPGRGRSARLPARLIRPLPAGSFWLLDEAAARDERRRPTGRSTAGASAQGGS